MTDESERAVQAAIDGEMRLLDPEVRASPDRVRPVRGRVGRPRRKPDSLFADRGYDHDIYRDQVRARGIVPAIARRGTRHVRLSLAWLAAGLRALLAMVVRSALRTRSTARCPGLCLGRYPTESLSAVAPAASKAPQKPVY